MKQEKFVLEKMQVRWNSDLDFSAGFDLAKWNSLEREVEVSPSYALGKESFALPVGTRIHLRHCGYRCTLCGRDVRKLFDAYCYPCFQKRPEADRCLQNPHLCHFNSGTCRSDEFAKEFCYQSHALYVSFTDKYKVGITRTSQIPTRWIDQGATRAAVLGFVSSRHQAGVLEKFLTTVIADKSHWSKMLSQGNSAPSAEEFALHFEKIRSYLVESESFRSGALKVPHVLGLESDLLSPQGLRQFRIRYPLSEMPEKFVSLNLEKTPEIHSEILGIKGQYLFLTEGVFNMRRHSGYLVDIEQLSYSRSDAEGSSTFLSL